MSGCLRLLFCIQYELYHKDYYAITLNIVKYDIQGVVKIKYISYLLRNK